MKKFLKCYIHSQAKNSAQVWDHCLRTEIDLLKVLKISYELILKELCIHFEKIFHTGNIDYIQILKSFPSLDIVEEIRLFIVDHRQINKRSFTYINIKQKEICLDFKNFLVTDVTLWNDLSQE